MQRRRNFEVERSGVKRGFANEISCYGYGFMSVIFCHKKIKEKKIIALNPMLAAVKNGLYEFHHGHPFLLEEEVDIICDTRFDEKYKWMNDTQIQELVKIRVKAMYRKKYPNAKRWRLLPIFNCS